MLMGIKSSPFGNTELSGPDAGRFVEQVQNETPNPAAVESLQAGREMLKNANEDGSITITTLPIEK